MADGVTPFSFGDLAERVGMALAVITGLVMVLKWLTQLHLASMNERMQTLEGVIKERDSIIAKRDEKIEALQTQLLAVVTSHGHDMQSLVTQLLGNDRANRDCLRAMIERLDTMNQRPCHALEHLPHPQHTPTPPPRQVPITDRTPGPG